MRAVSLANPLLSVPFLFASLAMSFACSSTVYLRGFSTTVTRHGCTQGVPKERKREVLQNLSDGASRLLLEADGVAGIDDQAAEAAAPAMLAYEFFLSGKHPYGRFLGHLDNNLRPERAALTGKTQASAQAYSSHRAIVSVPFGYSQQLQLYALDGISESVQSKLSHDFLLAQLFRPDTEAAMKALFPADAIEQVKNSGVPRSLGLPLNRAIPILYAHRNIASQWLAPLLRPDSPEVMTKSAQQRLDGSVDAVLWGALQAAQSQQPYSPEFIAAAQRHNMVVLVQSLVMCAGEAQWAQLPDLLRIMDEQAALATKARRVGTEYRNTYAPLLSKPK